MASQRRFSRPTAKRKYRKLFVLATEGSTTEPQYFSMFKNQNTTLQIKCLKNKNKSSPDKVLKRMEKYLQENELKNTDQAWLVIDKDQWIEAQLQQLYQWSQKENNYGLAVSNPKFEYWLLLHFEDAKGVSNAKQCDTKLREYLPNYNKNIEQQKLTPHIKAAINRAKQKDNPPCRDWHRQIGTTVYRLVEQLQS